MPLPGLILQSIHSVDDVVGLVFSESGSPVLRYLKVRSVEGTGVAPFSMGSASAMAAAGTGWNRIQDSSAREYLVPANEGVLYQWWYGITPSYAWVYRRFPAGIDRGNLDAIPSRNIGDPFGYVDGYTSPLRYPSVLTGNYTVKGTFVEFNGYHPFAEPSSVTIFLAFLIATFKVDFLKTPSAGDIARAKVFTMGGRSPAPVPDWLT